MREMLATGLIVMLAASGGANAGPMKVLSRDVAFPEGPIFVDRQLHLVDYVGHTILADMAGKLEPIWRRDGCGPSGLARIPEGLLVTCYDSNEIVAVSLDGRKVGVVDRDTDGRPFIGPNDLVADPRGGVWFTTSGPWETAPIVGKVYHRSADGAIREAAADLHYANGIALSPDGRRLYGAETYAYRVISFAVGADRTLTDRREPLRPGVVLGDTSGRAFAPDGIRVDAQGRLFIGLYEGGAVIVTSPDGALLGRVDPPAPHAPNLAITPDGSHLIIAGVFDEPGGGYRGEIYEAPNPVAGR